MLQDLRYAIRALARRPLVTSVAGLTVVLAAMGLYAVLAYGVALRLREIVRVALGAKVRTCAGSCSRRLDGLGWSAPSVPCSH